MTTYAFHPGTDDEKWAAHPAVYGLAPHQAFPRGDALNLDFLIAPPLPTRAKITRDHRIMCMGACFSNAIEAWLTRNGYSVIQWGNRPEIGAAGIVNTPSLCQELRRAFRSFRPALQVWRFTSKGKDYLLDPYRYRVTWKREEDIESELAAYRESMRAAFTSCDVFIWTFGQRNVWFNADDGSIYGYTPPPSAFDPDRDKWRCTSYTEDLENMLEAHAILTRYNRHARWIVLVSPVMHHATFRQDGNAVADGFAAKAELRTVAEDFARLRDNVHYFPALEVAFLARPTKPRTELYRPDNVHIQPIVLHDVMRLFELQYLQ